MTICLLTPLLVGCGQQTALLYGAEPTRSCLRAHGFRLLETSGTFLGAIKNGDLVMLSFSQTEEDALRRASSLGPETIRAFHPLVTRNVYYVHWDSMSGETERLITACLHRSLVPPQHVFVGLPTLSPIDFSTRAQRLPLMVSAGWKVVSERSGAGLVQVTATGLTGFNKLAVRIEGSRRQSFEGQALAWCKPKQPDIATANSGTIVFERAQSAVTFEGLTPAAFRVPLATGCRPRIEITVRTEGTRTAKVALIGR